MRLFRGGFGKVVPVLILVLALLSSAALAAGGDIITGAKYTVTANKDGTFTLNMNENLGAGESFTWATLEHGQMVTWESYCVLPADANGKVDLADELYAEMANIIDIDVFGDDCLDLVINMAFAHGNTTSKTITLPKGSDMLIVGRTMPSGGKNYCLITLGGTNLEALTPGGTGGNGMTGDPVLPPDTGDHTNAMLWLSLMLVSASAIFGMRKRAKTR